jgi:hypothetical protein
VTSQAAKMQRSGEKGHLKDKCAREKLGFLGKFFVNIYVQYFEGQMERE